jgi:hypothetical protein
MMLSGSLVWKSPVPLIHGELVTITCERICVELLGVLGALVVEEDAAGDAANGLLLQLALQLGVGDLQAHPEQALLRTGPVLAGNVLNG